MQLMRRTLATLALLAAASRAQDTLEASGGDQELGSGGGEVTIEAGSGGSGEAEVVLEHSVSYSMASSDGSFTISVTLEERSDSADLHLVCDVAAQDEAAMFADSSCLPQLYLVAGHASCAALPDTVSAKQLTEIAAAGHGEVLVAAAYSELPGKCLLVLQSASCGQAEGSGSGGGEVEVVDSRQVGLGEEGYLPAGAAVLRAGGLARTYSSISLAGFTLLSAGSTSAFTVAVPAVQTYSSAVVIPGVTVTNYNKWATLPYLQLTGWRYSDALNIVGLIALVLVLSQLPRLSSLFSLAPTVKRRFVDLLDYAESDQFSARMDALQDGVLDILDRTKDSIAHPWVGAIKSIGREYFHNVNPHKFNDYYYATRKIDDYDYEPHQASYYEADNVVTSESESQYTYNFNDIFPEFDKFMSFIK